MLSFQIFISSLAGPLTMFFLVTATAILLYKIHDGKESYILFFSSTLAMCISYTLKYLLKVPRPDMMLVPEADFRFPSGHATMASVVMALGMHYAHAHIKNKSLRYTLLEALSVFSLLFLFSHYLNILDTTDNLVVM